MSDETSKDIKKEISQSEIDDLNIHHQVPIADELRNLVILIRNELNTVEKEADTYDESKAGEIKKKLNKILDWIIHIRK